MGCEGWGWDDVAPYFRRAEHQERGESDWHATGGPLNVSDVTEKNPISNAVIEACEQAGIPRNDDVNGVSQEGATYYQLTVKNGQRCSAAVAYLHPAMNRPNLRVETNALAGKVLFEGKRAVGVEFTQNGMRRTATANAEVILAGDICYEKPMAEAVMDWLRQGRANGASVLIGDPGRTYFRRDDLVKLAEYQVETTRELEEARDEPERRPPELRSGRRLTRERFHEGEQSKVLHEIPSREGPHRALLHSGVAVGDQAA